MCSSEIQKNLEELSELSKKLSNSLTLENSLKNNFLANMLVQFVENSPFVCFVKNTDLKFVYVNKPMEEQRGLTKEQIIDKTATELINSGEGQLLDKHAKEVLESGRMRLYLETLPNGRGNRVKSVAIKFPFKMGNDTYVGGISIPIEFEICNKCKNGVILE